MPPSAGRELHISRSDICGKERCEPSDDAKVVLFGGKTDNGENVSLGWAESIEQLDNEIALDTGLPGDDELPKLSAGGVAGDLILDDSWLGQHQCPVNGEGAARSKRKNP